MIVGERTRLSRPERSERAREGSVDGERLPRSEDGGGRGRVAGIQRTRVIRAMYDVTVEKGAAGSTVAEVVERAGVSRRTFYEMFDDRDECFLAAFDDALAYAADRVVRAYEAQRSWRERIRAGLVALLGFLDEEPVIGRVLIVESSTVGTAAYRCRRDAIARVIAAVDQGSDEAAGSKPPAPLMGEGIVGGALAVIHARLAEADHEPLTTLVNQLMSMIVLPYLGAGAARRELERPTPHATRPRVAELPLTDPFKGTGLRVTYRTVRVLSAIADLDRRGAETSNRLIADTAEVKDQGQISKLLTRLRRAGMITNTGAIARGVPNSWQLTEAGRRVVATVTNHTEGHAPESHPR